MKRACQHCGTAFEARPADVKRGWARFCSKSCKAKEQENRTGQYRGMLEGPTDLQEWERREVGHDEAMDCATADWFEGGWRD